MVKTFITAVVAHIDHGKTTLIDSLIAATGHIPKSVAGEIRYLDTRIDEQSRGITLKLSVIELQYKNKYIIIDTPGHVDFESLVQVSSKLSDSFILMVDINEGITPRLFSIVKFITKNTILVLNKIDKQFEKTADEIYSSVTNVIIRVNSLLGYELFCWDKNNIVIAWSTMCVGVSKKEFETISKHCGLKNCIIFLLELNKRILTNQVEKLCNKYNIKSRDIKNIWSGVFPLARILFETIETNFEESKNIDTGLNGITMYCTLQEPKILKLDNLLFIVRLFSGQIVKDQQIKCKGQNAEKNVQIEKLYKFCVNSIKEIDLCKAPSLLLVKSNLTKHSFLYLEHCELQNSANLCSIIHKPFYNANIILQDTDETDRFKEALKTLSFLEPIFKVKLNKYGEYEFFCEGKVHFEKVCQDLIDNDFKFTVCKQKMYFHETCGKRVVIKDDVDITVNHCENMPETHTCAKGTNTLLCNSIKYSDVVTSVFEYLVNHGPLIGEALEFTHFKVDINDNKEFEEPFNTIKKCMVAAYNQSGPKIVPLYLTCKIQTIFEYIGNVYKTLHKFNYVLKDEIYNNEAEFFEIIVYFPQFQYYGFVDDLRMKTKGTCYIEFEDYGYMNSEKHKFDAYVDEIKRAKGMFTEKLIMLDPEKQRTLKK